MLSSREYHEGGIVLNQQEIGRFIMQMRKEKEMTQKQLAEKIGVSDKAISRWETGKGLPDTATMPELCRALDINVNELLSGERLSDGTYNGKAEENMVYLMKVSENKKKNEKLVILGTITGMLVLAFSVFCMVYLSGGMGMLLSFIDFPSLIIMLVLVTIILAIGGQMKAFIYAFKYALWIQTDKDLEEKRQDMQKSYYALKYAMRALLIVGLTICLSSVVIVLGSFSTDIGNVGKSLGVAIIGLLYAILFNLFLFPIRGLLHNKILR